jgi:two-component system phosphate regulon response regulator PhoB
MGPVVTVFLVDGDRDTRESLTEYLLLEDIHVRCFSGVTGVREAVIENHPSLIVLEVDFPDGDGFLLARELRIHTKAPVIFLTSRDSESDRITGFEIGADDYVVKPFSPKEMVLRIRAHLRRTIPLDGGSVWSGRWVLEDKILRIDEENHQIHLEGKEVFLTCSEWKVLTFLVFHGPEVRSRDEILSGCLEYCFDGYDRTVDTHIKNIRAKLDHAGWIETIRGYGYRFRGQRLI